MINPRNSVIRPIVIFNVLVGIFLTTNAEKGTDKSAPIIKDGARPQFTVSGDAIKMITPTTHVSQMVIENI